MRTQGTRPEALAGDKDPASPRGAIASRGFNNRCAQVEEEAGQCGDRTVEIIESEEQNKKKKTDHSHVIIC